MLGIVASQDAGSAPAPGTQLYAANSSVGVATAVAIVPINKSDLGTVNNGDLLLAFCWANNSTSTWSSPGFSTAAAAGDAAILWRVADGTELSTISFTRAVSTTGFAAVTLVRITGAHPTAPIDVAGISSSAGVTTLSLGSLTTTGPSEMLFQFAARGSTGALTATAPASATKRYDALSTGTTGLGNAGGDEMVNAGATGTRTWTFSAAGPNRGGMVAIKSA